jgi:hypothetical protein
MIQNFFHEYVSHPPIKQNMTKSMATYKISFIAVYICPNARRHSVVSGNELYSRGVVGRGADRPWL